METVRDGDRHLKFEGTLLASSSSRQKFATRWVEFTLFRTLSGQYVLARIGQSICYHKPSCSVVSRNRIDAFPREALEEHYVPCPECRPQDDLEVVCPEQPRYWAQVSDSSEGVVHSLKKFDDNGTAYLTNVAKRLLVEASLADDAIHEAFYEERIL